VHSSSLCSRALERGDIADMASVSYKYPAFHSFPPSYTLQPVAGTRTKQVTLWCDLIRDYCAHHRIFWLTFDSVLFRNDSIDRRLSDTDVKYFLGELVARGDAEWDTSRQRVLVYWRRPAEWGQLIWKWVEKCGMNGQVVTIHEMRSQNSVPEINALELDTTMRALQALESEGKCAIMEGQVNDGLGVKFAN